MSLDRSTAIGKQINAYLSNEIELEDHSIHLLFAANRWEMVYVTVEGGRRLEVINNTIEL